MNVTILDEVVTPFSERSEREGLHQADRKILRQKFQTLRAPSRSELQRNESETSEAEEGWLQFQCDEPVLVEFDENIQCGSRFRTYRGLMAPKTQANEMCSIFSLPTASNSCH